LHLKLLDAQSWVALGSRVSQLYPQTLKVMPLDPARFLALPPIETQFNFTKRDTILYALGVGAQELRFVYEDGLQALPTMAAVMAHPGFFWRKPQYGVDWKRILHGENSLEIHAPLPVEGTVRGVTTFGPIFDKGADKGAVIYQTRKIFDSSGLHLATEGAAFVCRGDGGFGGNSEGQPKPQVLPTRDPDLTYLCPTAENQALIYRLSGDYNPLHANAAVAREAGFDGPILHGLCTYGVACRAILAALCESEPSSLKRLNVRFSSPVYPGETIRTDIWRERPGRAFFRATVTERDVVILNNGLAEYVGAQ
jgi:acyl dehydratase